MAAGRPGSRQPVEMPRQSVSPFRSAIGVTDTGLERPVISHKILWMPSALVGHMSDTSGVPRWTPATGDHAERQLHAMEFIASSLDRIDGHLDRIATSIAGTGPHKPFSEAFGDQLRALGEA